MKNLFQLVAKSNISKKKKKFINTINKKKIKLTQNNSKYSQKLQQYVNTSRMALF